MPEIHVSGGITIPSITCEKCDKEADGVRGGNGRYTLQCTNCGARVFVFTSPTAPLLSIWKRDCPEGVPFYDYARVKMGQLVGEYTVNKARTGTVEVPDVPRTAAPG